TPPGRPRRPCAIAAGRRAWRGHGPGATAPGRSHPSPPTGPGPPPTVPATATAVVPRATTTAPTAPRSPARVPEAPATSAFPWTHRGRRAGAATNAGRPHRARGRPGGCGGAATTPAAAAATAATAIRDAGSATRSWRHPGTQQQRQQRAQPGRAQRPRVALQQRSHRARIALHRLDPVDLGVDAGELRGVARAERLAAGHSGDPPQRRLVDV